MQQLLTEANSFKFKFIKFELIVLTLQHHLQLSFELLRLTIEPAFKVGKLIWITNNFQN